MCAIARSHAIVSASFILPLRDLRVLYTLTLITCLSAGVIVLMMVTDRTNNSLSER